ncbi:MAG: MFS transporter [Candidatus Thermoplasmatota archaeon]
MQSCIFHLQPIQFFKSFHKTFWLVNILELLERGAYYGMMAVFSYHLAYNASIPTWMIGLLFTVLMPLLYFVPIIAASIAEKYGYKNVLIFAFICLIIAYFSIGFFTSIIAIFLFIVILGIGAGSFKPMVSATIAHVTLKEQRNLGYSIYYWMINLGAFTVPLLIGITIPEANYYLAFFLASFLITINLLLTIFLFKEPKEKDIEKGLGIALKSAVLILRDIRFLLLLLIYSGFWFMYSMNHSYLPLYMKDFKLMPDWFTVALLATINPGTIITIGPLVGKAVEKYASLNLMIFGICIFLIGFAFLGLFHNPFLFIFGIIIFSIGEFITHPNFISYVSKIAQKDKVAIYMGYAFIPTGIGLTLGTFFGGFLYQTISEQMFRPKLFWAFIISIGLITIALLIIYNVYYTKGKFEISIPKNIDGLWNSFIPIVLIALLIPSTITIGYAGGTAHFYRGEVSKLSMDWKGYEIVSNETNIDDKSFENSDTIKIIKIEEMNIKNITFTLTWKDEDDKRYLLRVYKNQPDEFSIKVLAPNGKGYESELVSNKYGEEGSVSIEISFEPNKEKFSEGTGLYNVTIHCGNAGDYTSRYGVLSFEDNGNEWKLRTIYEYYERR